MAVFPRSVLSKEVTPSTTPAPNLLIEVMSHSNLDAEGLEELKQKLKDAFKGGCKAVWLVYNEAAPFDQNAVGVQVFYNEHELNFLKKPLANPDEELDDKLGFLQKIKAKELLDI